VIDSVDRGPAKPLLLYDGECGFCCKWVARWQEKGEGKIDFAPSQSGAGESFGFSATESLGAVQLIDTNLEIRAGAAAVFCLMALCGGLTGLTFWYLYQRVPLFRLIMERGYRMVATHRTFASWLTTVLWGVDVRKPTYMKASRMFLRLLALTYAVAFGGLWWQVGGLLGPHGILPAGEFLEHIQGILGNAAYNAVPSLFWVTGGTARALNLVCGAGTILALAAFFHPRLLVGPLFLTFEIFYLSLVNVGQIFMGYQWDALLLEAGFLSIFLAPWSRHLRWPNFLSSSARWLLIWLLFRLMFSSALVKWVSGDPAWRDLSALDYHFWTQPLPNPGGWVAGQLPDSILRCMTFGMFLIEGCAPWLLIGPRNVRFLGAVLIALLQLMIAMTGNYGFFNLLTLALCVLAVDDHSFSGPISSAFAGNAPGHAIIPYSPVPSSPGRMIITLCAAFLFLISLVPIPLLPMPSFLVSVYEALAPWHIVSGYGLFAVMTKHRSEIIIEGSNDGINWKPYAFRFKPGDLHRAPPFVPLLMPRLDWQMWFASLGTVDDNPWFENFLLRLFQADHSVLALLAADPFHGLAPRYLRARMEQYQFATPGELRRDGVWWTSQPGGNYLGEVELRDAEKP